ncbi:hypothetical protein ACRQF6_03835 [Actinotignum sp. GS-2025f]|uniref:hypothetical protein n=1 Tax=unclassified Actinotignum TaxID=2632702 RepID=UPI002A7F407A|nr:hypothetical protein [Actinotignum sp. SLA_B059]MDY5126909.1 hypothetical protein [Actinotignum sp. SLA_B059]
MSASEAGRGAETSGSGEVAGPGGVKRQGGEVTLRSRGQIVKGGFLIALGLAPLIFIAAGVAMPFSAPVAFFLAAGITGAAWSFFFLPELRYNAEGLSIINPLRTIRLPWGAVARFTTRFYLTTHAQGGEHWDAAAFPAGGALAAGRRLLPARHPAAARHVDLPVPAGRGTATRWVTLSRAAEQLRAAQERARECAPSPVPSTNRPVRSVDLGRAVLCVAWVACLAAACGLAFT